MKPDLGVRILAFVYMAMDQPLVVCSIFWGNIASAFTMKLDYSVLCCVVLCCVVLVISVEEIQ